MANDDTIYEAYMGAKGEKVQADVKKRIGWIVDRAAGFDRIWDVGCSQGITSILLARQGKRVIGLDVQPEAIDFAQNLLETEYPELRETLQFVCADFFTWQPEGKADCIIMTEVLEHLGDPGRFLEIAAGRLAANGCLIVTVPFGVNDHPDHHTTFYMKNLHDLVSRYLDIVSWEFMGRWEGLKAVKKGTAESPFLMDEVAVDLMEAQFELIDRQDVQRIEVMYNQLMEGSKKYRQVTVTNTRLKKKAEHVDEYIAALAQAEADYAELIHFLSAMRRGVQQLQTQVAYLRTENKQYRLKLAKITDTWCGRLAIKVWRLLKRIKAKLLGKK